VSVRFEEQMQADGFAPLGEICAELGVSKDQVIDWAALGLVACCIANWQPGQGSYSTAFWFRISGFREKPPRILRAELKKAADAAERLGSKGDIELVIYTEKGPVSTRLPGHAGA
jgi:hypothetical protein